MSGTREIIREQSHPPQLLALSVLDRMALHVGLGLIRWAEHTKRKPRPTTHERFASVEQRREIAEARHRIGLIG